MFKNTEPIKLQPNDTKYGVSFYFPIETAYGANDGAIPFGTKISSAAVTSSYNGTTINDMITGPVIVSGDDLNIVQLSLNYPATTMANITKTVTMSLRFILTLTDTSTREFDYRNVVVGNQ
jgi:hypothetical protein